MPLDGETYWAVFLWLAALEAPEGGPLGLPEERRDGIIFLD
jgi:hypothetical protein